MRLSFIAGLVLLLIGVSAVSCPAQATKTEPQYTVLFFIDYKPLNFENGVLASAQKLTVKGELSPESIKANPQFEPEVVLDQGSISLVREGRRIGFIPLDGTLPLSTLSKQAQAGDRYVIQVNGANLRTKQGKTQRIGQNRVYAVPLREG